MKKKVRKKGGLSKTFRIKSNYTLDNTQALKAINAVDKAFKELNRSLEKVIKNSKRACKEIEKVKF